MAVPTLRRSARITLGLTGAVVAGQVAALVGNGRAIPVGIVLLSVVYGAVNALLALGLVLVYRSTRIVNFAQAGFGTTAGLVFFLLAGPSGQSYWLSLAIGLGVAGLLGFVVEAVVIRRFLRAPRLVLTVVTIALAQFLAGIGSDLSAILAARPPERFRTPFTGLQVDIGSVVFTGDHLFALAVVAAVFTGLFAFFRFSLVGIAVRGVADNRERASLIGVEVASLSSLVWVTASLLSGVAAILLISVDKGTGATTGGLGLGLLLPSLTAAVLGRMESLPVTAAAAVGLAVFQRSVVWAFPTSSAVDVILFAVVVGALLLQRRRLSRASDGDGGSWAAAAEVRPVPPELLALPGVRAARRWAFAAVVVAVAAYPWLMSPSQTRLGGVFAIYGIVGVSLVILTGWGGQISLGQFAFAAVGGAVGGGLTGTFGWPFLLALPIGCLAGAAVAVLVGLPALRIQGLFLAVTTLAFAIVTSSVLLNERYFGWLLPSRVERPRILGFDTADERVWFYLCVGALGCAVFVAQGLRSSRTGRVLIAMRDNERAAQAFGVNLVRTRLATFAISGFLAAFAGVLFVHQQGVVSAGAFRAETSIQLFLMAIIGGLGSVVGVVLGAVYLGLSTFVFTGLAAQLLTGSVGVLVVLLFFPGGLGSAVFGMRDAMLRRTAVRHRILVPSLLADFRVIEGNQAKVPLAPKSEGRGTVNVPVRYRLPSRILVAGSSQRRGA